MDLIKIGKFISNKRKQNNLTQVELAERLGVSDRAVSKWENGVCLPDADNMLALCEALHIGVGDLLNGEEIDMKEANEVMEKQLIELKKAKEESDKRMLRMEIVIGVMATAMLLAGVLVASYVSMPTWAKVLVIVGAVVISMIGFASALRIEQKAGYYKCGKCEHTFVPGYAQVLLAPHVNRSRYMKCPHCGKYAYCRKVLRAKEDTDRGSLDALDDVGDK